MSNEDRIAELERLVIFLCKEIRIERLAACKIPTEYWDIGGRVDAKKDKG